MHQEQPSPEPRDFNKGLPEARPEETSWVPIASIKVAEKGHQKLDQHKIEKHRRAFEEGKDIAPIDVVRIEAPGQNLSYRILGNGRHRFWGAVQAGYTEVPVQIHGSRLEEIPPQKREAA